MAALANAGRLKWVELRLSTIKLLALRLDGL
jgi:hypothetical protein